MWFVTINGNLFVVRDSETALYLMERATHYREEFRKQDGSARDLRITLVRKAA